MAGLGACSVWSHPEIWGSVFGPLSGKTCGQALVESVGVSLQNHVVNGGTLIPQLDATWVVVGVVDVLGCMRVRTCPSPPEITAHVAYTCNTAQSILAPVKLSAATIFHR
jgi:hypothetical protein